MSSLSFYFFSGIAAAGWLIFKYFKDPLRNVPGPFWARITPLWLYLQIRGGRRYKAVHAAHERYGPIVRIAPNHVSINDGDAIPTVYGHGGGGFDKSKYYEAFVEYGSPSIFAVIDRTTHSKKRRKFSHAFSIKMLGIFTPYIYNMTIKLMERMDDISDNNQYVDLVKWFNYYTWDTISDILFGEPFEFIKKGSDWLEGRTTEGETFGENVISSVDHREHTAAAIGVFPSIRYIAQYIPDPFLARGNQSKDCLRFLARQQVEKQIVSGATKEDLLNQLIEGQLKAAGNLGKEQVDEIVAEIVTLLIAGTHTVAATSSALIHYISTNPGVYGKIMDELLAVVGEGQIPTEQHIRKLEYLQATITEGLRLHSTNATGLHRTSPDTGVVLHGKFIPKDVEISIPAWSVHHNPKYWSDPFTFRPERWLENLELRRYFLAFGAGPRNCLGKHVANTEILFLISSILLRFQIELKSPVLETIERFQHEPENVYVKLRRRNRNQLI